MNVSGVNGTFSGNASIGGNLTVSGNLTASQAITFNAGTGTFSQITTNNQQSALTTDNVNLYSNNTGTVTVGNTTGTLAIRKPTTTLTNLTSSGTITGNTIQSTTTGTNPNLYTSNTGNITVGSTTGSLIINKPTTTAKTVSVDKITLSGANSATSGVNAVQTSSSGSLTLISGGACILAASTSSDASGNLTRLGGSITCNFSGLGGSIDITSPASSIGLSAATDVNIGGAGFLNCNKTLKCNTAQSLATTDTVNLYTTSGGGAIINLGGNSTIVNVGTGTSNTVQMGSLSSTVNVNALNLNLTAQNNVNIPVGTGGSLLSCQKDFTVTAGRTAFLNTISSTTNPSNCVLFQNAGTGTITIGDPTSTTLINGTIALNNLSSSSPASTVNLYSSSTGATINIATGTGNTINIGNFLSTVAIPASISLTNVSLNKITPSYSGTIPTYGTGDIGYSLTVSNTAPVFLVPLTQVVICQCTLPAQGTYAINYWFNINTPGATTVVQWGISPIPNLTPSSLVRNQLKTRTIEQQTNGTGSLSRNGSNIINTKDWETLVIYSLFSSDTSSATIPSGDTYINYTRIA